MSAPHLTEENALLVLRASGQSGHRTADALYREDFRRICFGLARQGYARVRHKNSINETIFITNKGLEKSVGGGE